MWLLAHSFLLLYVRMRMYRGPETTKGHKIEQKEFKGERLRRTAEHRWWQWKQRTLVGKGLSADKEHGEGEKRVGASANYNKYIGKYHMETHYT